MTIRQLPNPKSQWFNSSGAPLSGGKVYTYIAGTSTAKNTYSDHLGTTPNANPVILDSRGEATIYWDGSYKVIVKDSNDVTIYTLDNHGGGSIDDVSAQRSLVLNYSFEDDDDGDGVPDNWTVTLYTGGTQTLDTSAGGQIHGAKAIKFTSTGTGGGYAESELFLVHEAESVTATWAMKSSDAGVRNLVELVWYDRAQSVLSTSSIYDDSTTNPTSFTDKNGTATAPANARFAKIRLTGCHSSDATVGSTWFDDVRISPGYVTETGTQTLTNKTFDAITVTSTDASATAGPFVDLYRNSASPAASDAIAAIRYKGEDSAGNETTYAQVRAYIDDPTNASEDGGVIVDTVVAGTLAGRVTIGQGVQVGAPTGGDKGSGTANFAGSVYQNNIKLGRVVIGTVNFNSVGAGGTGTTNITHGLGTDDVYVIASVQSTDSNWRFKAIRPSGAEQIMRGKSNNELATGGSLAPATGLVNLEIWNSSASTQSYTVNYCIIG